MARVEEVEKCVHQNVHETGPFMGKTIEGIVQGAIKLSAASEVILFRGGSSHFTSVYLNQDKITFKPGDQVEITPVTKIVDGRQIVENDIRHKKA